MPGGMNRGFRMGRGGRGYRHMFYATGLTGWQRAGTGAAGVASPAPAAEPTLSQEEELQALKAQAEAAAATLEQLRRRIEEIAGSRESQT